MANDSKEYDNWFPQKIKFNQRTNPPSFQEREIWWCHIGVNIGYEIFGKSDFFTRPVLIIRKYGQTFLCAPLRTAPPRNKLHVPYTDKQGKTSTILLDQLRTLDAKRLKDRPKSKIPQALYLDVLGILREDLTKS